MSQKVEKPILSGQRIKSRKRDEKEKYTPFIFQDSIITGLNKAKGDMDAVWKFLDNSGSKLDYRRYGETLFDILIAGSLLIPGGGIHDANKVTKTLVCIFDQPEDMATLHKFEEIFLKLIRRYKYLEKIFYEEMNKVLLYIRGFTDLQRIKLARMTALWISSGTLSPHILRVLLNEHMVKDGTALDFFTDICLTWKQERGMPSFLSALKKGHLEGKLMEFLPLNKRNEAYFKLVFEQRGLNDIVKLHLARENQLNKKHLESRLIGKLSEGHSTKELITDVEKLSVKFKISEMDVVVIIWNVLMSRVEWNKKEELLIDQALKHLNKYASLLAAFAVSPHSEYVLLLKIQEYCYDNMNFMKAFQKILVLLYKTDVISETVILKWYSERQSTKGKMLFVQQTKKFVEWLQNAEEESDCSEDEQKKVRNAEAEKLKIKTGGVSNFKKVVDTDKEIMTVVESGKSKDETTKSADAVTEEGVTTHENVLFDTDRQISVRAHDVTTERAVDIKTELTGKIEEFNSTSGETNVATKSNDNDAQGFDIGHVANTPTVTDVKKHLNIETDNCEDGIKKISFETIYDSTENVSNKNVDENASITFKLDCATVESDCAGGDSSTIRGRSLK